jgi:choline dehydrogenase-like flavoprotein
VITDFRTLPDSSTIDADLCIIGAGPAGITIAREFIGTGIRVCLLESGGDEPRDDTQNLCAGENVGLPYFPLDATRVRTLGGTSYHWGGRSAPMLPIEFEDRDWVPHGGWPIRFSDLDTHYRAANKICDLGPYTYGPENWQHENFVDPQFDPKKIQARFWRYSTPTRFGPKYRAALEQSDNVAVYLNASVTNIEATDDGNRAQQVHVRALNGTSGRVNAQAFVLACGGMDNPRLLLSSNGIEPLGLGNRNDAVGRYFMGHLEDQCGELISDDPRALARLFAKDRTDRVVTLAGVCPSEHLQRTQRILSCGMAFSFLPDLDSGIGAGKSIAADFQHGRIPEQFGTKLWRVLSDMDDIAPAAYARVFKGEPLTGGIRSLTMASRQEQAPNPESRITLADEKDAIGMNRVRLNWQVTELDKRSALTFTQTIANEFGRLNMARLKIPEWLLSGGKDWTPKMRGHNHHMGTTRMSADPKKGVVDQNCRVHSMDNLFVAGSSVFATSGYANPTLTIVALALRLADHLKQKYA